MNQQQHSNWIKFCFTIANMFNLKGDYYNLFTCYHKVMHLRVFVRGICFIFFLLENPKVSNTSVNMFFNLICVKISAIVNQVLLKKYVPPLIKMMSLNIVNCYLMTIFLQLTRPQNTMLWNAYFDVDFWNTFFFLNKTE